MRGAAAARGPRSTRVSLARCRLVVLQFAACGRASGAPDGPASTRASQLKVKPVGPWLGGGAARPRRRADPRPELESIRETARERLVRAEAAEGELASVARKLADAQAVYASGLADRDAKLRDLEATLRRLRTQAAPSSVAVQSELAARDRTIDALQRECTLAQAALEAANAEVAASRAALGDGLSAHKHSYYSD